MKLLVSDYDGTFKEENNNKNIKANIEAIKKFTKNGNIFALATGRNFTSIKSETTRYNIPYKYLICNDGSTIFNAKDELVYKYPIPENILEESLEYLSSLSYIKKLILLNEFGLETNDTSSVIEIICALNLKNLHKLREMKKNIEYLESISLFNYVSFKNQINKRDGIKLISLKEKIEPKNIYTIGNDKNDLEMLTEYNGYKVYWEDGAQITAPKDSLIINEVNSITDFGTLKTMDKDEAIKAGLYNVVADEVDDAYIAELKKQVINPDVVKEMGDKLVAVYTPLHGTGNIPARRVLKEIGLNKVYVVPEQELPDGDFPTVGYPNPEDPKAFELALKLADEVNADVVLATDPDADRLGVYAKDSATGKYMSFTGNMSGMLIAEYILSEKKAKGILPKNGALIKTIVTTNLADVVAKEYNVKLIEVLTGFKYIGEQIKLFEQNHSYEYVFGFEESYGCLVGTHARDKDAIVAVMMLCEAAAYYKKHGLTLWDQMLRIYEKYGYFKETLVSITKKGKEGHAEIQGMLDKLRSNPPKEIGGYKVLETRDYNNNTVTKADGTVTETGLPKSNVLYFDLEDNAWCCARPSGTEPKIKFYMGVKGNSFDDADAKLEKLKNDMMAIVE